MIHKISNIDFCVSALNRIGWGYVYGGQGELYTPDVAAEMYKKNGTSKYNKKYYCETQLKRWHDVHVVDCSGLVGECINDADNHIDLTADSFYKSCAIKGDIKTLPEIKGLVLWKKGHIGIYIGGGYVVESKNSEKGVVQTKLYDTASKFTNWGKLTSYVTYDGISPETYTLCRVLKRTIPNLYGGDVRKVQEKLVSLGYDIGIDGYYGIRTKKAVEQFQLKHPECGTDNKPDGKVGKKTAEKLGFRWYR